MLAFIAFPDVASCFAPIPDGTVPEELAGVWPVFHSSQPSLNSGFVGCLAGIACLAKVSTYEGLVDWMWDGPRLWFNIWTMSIFLRLACFFLSFNSSPVSLLASMMVSLIVRSNRSGVLCCVVPVIALGPFEPSGGGPPVDD